MKSTLGALAALAIGAGTLKAGDPYWEQQRRSEEFNRQQAEWQAQFDRNQAEFEHRRYERQQEQRFQDLENRINNQFDCDY